MQYAGIYRDNSNHSGPNSITPISAQCFLVETLFCF